MRHGILFVAFLGAIWGFFLRQANADIVLPTPTAVSTKVPPKAVLVAVGVNYSQKSVTYLVQRFDIAGKPESETRGVASYPTKFPPQLATPIAALKSALEKGLAGVTPIPGITPLAKGSSVAP